jgi:hypothetical protein
MGKIAGGEYDDKSRSRVNENTMLLRLDTFATDFLTVAVVNN